MDFRTLKNVEWDMQVREGIEHIESFWNLRLLTLRQCELVDEMERSMLAQEMNEFHRRCVDNDKPGLRHMLPFIWFRPHGYGNDGDNREQIKLPIKVGTSQYNLIVSRYEKRMAELKRRTPNYGRKI